MVRELPLSVSTHGQVVLRRADDKSFVLKMNNALLELKIEEVDNVKIEIELNVKNAGTICFSSSAQITSKEEKDCKEYRHNIN